MAKHSYRVVAVMSGTSLDGIDVINANFSFNGGWEFKIDNAETVSYSEEWKVTLSQLVNTSIAELKKIDVSYSKYLAHIINHFIDKYNISEIDFVSSHGHTALHQPEKRLTYQIGNLQVLADILKQKVICDFRLQDVELGGQGAPLVPIGDRLLFGNYRYCLNLGGFANISFEKNNKRIAYDICPVNIVMNHCVSNLGLAYDDKGQIASSGIISYELLEQLNQLEYYREKSPKSLGLEWVKLHIIPLIDSYELNVEDVLRTYVEHIAVQISENFKVKNSEVLITGGGVYNEFLIERIKVNSNVSIIMPEKEIIEFKEALIFGLLGVLKDRDDINCLKSVTGANNDHSSGKILLPKT